MSAIDRGILRRFVDLACRRLSGDWVLLGGTVLPLLGIERRTTLDIDVAGPEEADIRQLLLLMEIAEELGLPPEAINQAGALYLHRIEGWRDHLILIQRGPSARLHRPDATLFVLSKISRLSESDLGDCLCMLEHASRIGEAVDTGRLREVIRGSLGEMSVTPERRERLRALRAHLGGR